MNKGFQVGWWLIVLNILVMNLSVMAIAHFAGNLNEYVYSVIGEVMIFIPVFLGCLYSKKYGNSVKSTLGLQGFSPVILPLAILILLGAQQFVLFITMPVQSVLMVLFGMDNATTTMLVPEGAWEFIFAAFVLCVVAPVMEEFLCRGVLIKLFEKYGFMVSLFASSIGFALLHFEAQSFIPILFVGMIFGVFRICTGSVWLTVILHSLNNLMGLCQLTFFGTDAMNVLNIITICAAVLFPFVMYFTFAKAGRFMKNIKNINMQREKTGVSVGAIVCAGLFVLFNVYVFAERLINGECFNDLLTFMGR